LGGSAIFIPAAIRAGTQAIADLAFTGFVTHEYSPTQGNDPIAMLAKAIAICDV
jgi:hypothetical protein